MDKISTHLWFDDQAEQAARYYCELFPDSRIDDIVRAPMDYGSGKEGGVLQIAFSLTGRSFLALNGGPDVPFTEAISLSIDCEDQAKVDRYWKALSAHPQNEQCGWVKDRFGLSWQVIPRALPRLLGDKNPERAKRAMAAMMSMKKIDIAALEAAADNNGADS